MTEEKQNPQNSSKPADQEREQKEQKENKRSRQNGSPYSEIYAYRIKELCRKRGFSVNQVAVMSGVRQSTIDNIIHGVSKNPTTKTIHQIATAFGMTFSEFVDYPMLNEYPIDMEGYVDSSDKKNK